MEIYLRCADYEHDDDINLELRFHPEVIDYGYGQYGADQVGANANDAEEDGDIGHYS